MLAAPAVASGAKPIPVNPRTGLPYEHRITFWDYSERRRQGNALVSTKIPKVLNGLLYESYGAWYDYTQSAFLFPDRATCSAARSLCEQVLPDSAIPRSLRPVLMREGGVWCKESNGFWFGELKDLEAARVLCEAQLKLNLPEDREPPGSAATASAAPASTPAPPPPPPTTPEVAFRAECERRRREGFLLPIGTSQLPAAELQALDAIPERLAGELVGYLLPSTVAMDRARRVLPSAQARPPSAEPELIAESLKRLGFDDGMGAALGRILCAEGVQLSAQAAQ